MDSTQAHETRAEESGLQLIFACGAPIELWWSQIGPLLQESEEHWERYLGLDDIRGGLESGVYQAWMAVDEGEVVLVLVTTVDVYPRCKVLRHLLIGGGELKRAEPLLDLVELWAIRHNVAFAEGLGRPGWARFLRSHGYRSERVLVVKELRGIREH